MEATINGIRYNTDKCHELARFGNHDESGEYSGTTRLLEAGDGELLVYFDSKGFGEGCVTRFKRWSCEPYSNPIDAFCVIVDRTRMEEIGLIKYAPHNPMAIDEARNRNAAFDEIVQYGELERLFNDVGVQIEEIKRRISSVKWKVCSPKRYYKAWDTLGEPRGKDPDSDATKKEEQNGKDSDSK